MGGLEPEVAYEQKGQENCQVNQSYLDPYSNIYLKYYKGSIDLAVGLMQVELSSRL